MKRRRSGNWAISKVLPKNSKNYRKVEISKGDFWEFNSDDPNVQWVGRIERIQNFGRKGDKFDVRWLYSLAEANVPASGISPEQMFSNHIDTELDLDSTLKRKVNVHFYANKPKKSELRECDFHCWRSFDPVRKITLPNGQVLSRFKGDEYKEWYIIEELIECSADKHKTLSNGGNAANINESQGSSKPELEHVNYSANSGGNAPDSGSDIESVSLGDSDAESIPLF
jgi:hypothetical protein